MNLRVVVALWLTGCGSCKASAQVDASASEEPPEMIEEERGPRCAVEPKKTKIEGDVGGAVLLPKAIALGVTREGEASIAYVSYEGILTSVALGKTIIDAAPPAIASTGSNVYAAYRAKTNAGEQLVATMVEGTSVTPLRVLTRGDSDDVDVAADATTAFATWTEPRGDENSVVASAVTGDAGTKVTVSPNGTDAILPRAIRRQGQSSIVWLARKRTTDGGSNDGLEGAGEAKRTGWLELATLDATLAPISTHRITGDGVTGFDLAVDGADLRIVAREETGAGARIILIVVKGDVESPAVVLAEGDVGRSVPHIFVRSGSALTFSTNLGDDLVSLAEGGPILEPAIADARPLVDCAPAGQGSGTFRVAFWEVGNLRMAACRK